MNKQNWEHEYNTKLHSQSDGASRHCYSDCDQYIELRCKTLKSFIHQLLKSQRAELIDEIEGMKKEDEHSKNCSLAMSPCESCSEEFAYNQALEDVLTKLKNK